jgi:trimeric autotransporter adhesin
MLLLEQRGQFRAGRIDRATAARKWEPRAVQHSTIKQHRAAGRHRIARWPARSAPSRNYGLLAYAVRGGVGAQRARRRTLLVMSALSLAIGITVAVGLVTLVSPSTPLRAKLVGSVGSLPVGQAQYPVPTNAIFVAPNGDDAASGTRTGPLRTISAAIAKAGSGATIVLRAGTYHESVTIPPAKGGITIQAYPSERVWFDGSTVVSGWTQVGRTWVHSGWTARFDHSASFTHGDNSGGFVNPAYPMAAWPDQVFIDGAGLKQVRSAARVGPGTFFVSYSAQTLTIGTDPAGHVVRASDIERAFYVAAHGVTLRGFGVRRYATPLPRMGAVLLYGGGDVAQNVVVTDNATQGLSFSGAGNLADHVTAADNGMVGIHADTADSFTIQNSLIAHNNVEHFNPSPSAAGVKITRSRGVTIRDSVVKDTVGTKGIWLDESVVGFTLAGNTVTGQPVNVQVELSDTGIVADNTVSGGVQGIYLFDTGNVRVYNNDVSDNTIGSIFLSQDARREANPSDPGHDPRQPIPDPSCPWLTRNITVANNVFGPYPHGGLFQFYVLDKKTRIPADAMNLVITGNVFQGTASDPPGPGELRARTPANASRSQVPTLIGWGGGNNVTVTQYDSVAALQQAKNATWTNTAVVWTGDRALVRDASDWSAKPIPAGVAAVIGVPAGTRVVGTV